MKKQRPWLPMIFFCVGFLPAFVACDAHSDYRFYRVGSDETQKKLNFLFKTLAAQTTDDGRFILNLEISKTFSSLNQNALRNTYLLEQIQRHPNDLYNGYYLNLIANDYQSRNLPQMAAVYYQRIIRNCPSLQINGQSLHESVLRNLSQISDTPEKRLFYSNRFLTQFPHQSDIGKTYFLLADAYERLGQWEPAMAALRKFAEAPLAGLENEKELKKESLKKVRFYEYTPKNWAYRNLDDLVYAVKTAIRNKNNEAIKRSMSKVDFFTLSWAQEEKEANYNFVFNLATYMRGIPITFAPAVEYNATHTAAYLETNNWRYHIRTWYLYFQKIDFPADPSLHGKWEWAGIYFGEKPFNSAR